ncbi:hypothetical protein Tco_0948266, partial [Tanacetum coccineum]
TPGVFVSKKKAPAKGDKGKVMELRSDAALLEAAQADSQDDESNNDDDDNDNDNKDGKSKDDYGNSDADDNERTDSDDDEEETNEDEYVCTPNPEYGFSYDEECDDLYKDVDVKSLGAEHEKGRKGDVKMTDADQNKTKSSKQSSSVSSDIASKFLILDNVPPVVDKVASMMNEKESQEVQSTQISYILIEPITVIPDSSTIDSTIVPLTISMITPLPQLSTPSLAPTTGSTTTLILALLDFSSLFGFDLRVSTLEKELSQFKQADHSAQLLEYSTITESLENVILAKSSSQPQSTYEAATSLTERDHEDKDKDEDPPVGPNQGMKKRKTSKDAEPPRSSKSKDSQSSSSKGTKSQPKSSGKSVQEESVFETADTEMPQDQGDDMGNAEDQPNVEAAFKHDWFKKPEKPLTPDPD